MFFLYIVEHILFIVFNYSFSRCVFSVFQSQDGVKIILCFFPSAFNYTLVVFSSRLLWCLFSVSVSLFNWVVERYKLILNIKNAT